MRSFTEWEIHIGPADIMIHRYIVHTHRKVDGQTDMLLLYKDYCYKPAKKPKLDAVSIGAKNMT